MTSHSVSGVGRTVDGRTGTGRARLRHAAVLSAAAAAWLVLYRVNEPWWDLVVYRWFGLAADSHLGGGMHFFLYDSVKIVLLLVGIIFVVTVGRSYLSLERTRTLLGGRREGLSNVAAAGLGVATPFCSCSAVPAFIGFVAAGVPLGVTLSFLIASPMINEVAVVLLYGMFGFKVAALYIGSGLVIATVAGFVLGRTCPTRWVEPFVYQSTLHGAAVVPGQRLAWTDRVAMGRAEVVAILRKVWPYLLAGIGLGAVIHGWVPVDFFARVAGPDNPFAPVVAVAVGVPLYSNAAGMLPLVEVLHAKGVAMGTVLAFMMSVVALSLPRTGPVASGSQATVAGRLRRRGRRGHPRHRLSVQRHPVGSSAMHIKILGPGCGNCHALERLTREALTDLGVTADITAVTDYPAIVAYGVMSTPALIIDEQVVLAGRVPSRDQVRRLLANRTFPGNPLTRR